MNVLQPQGRVWLALLLAPVLGCCLCTGATADEPQKPPAPKASDRAAELKALLKERYDTLSKVVDHLTARYNAGVVDFGRVVQAEKEALKAAVEVEDSREKRLALLQKVRDSANQIVQLAEARFKARECTELDVLQARAVLLEARIELLREQLKAQPGK